MALTLEERNEAELQFSTEFGGEYRGYINGGLRWDADGIFFICKAFMRNSPAHPSDTCYVSSPREVAVYGEKLNSVVAWCVGRLKDTIDRVYKGNTLQKFYPNHIASSPVEADGKEVASGN